MVSASIVLDASIRMESLLVTLFFIAHLLLLLDISLLHGLIVVEVVRCRCELRPPRHSRRPRVHLLLLKRLVRAPVDVASISVAQSFLSGIIAVEKSSAPIVGDKPARGAPSFSATSLVLARLAAR